MTTSAEDLTPGRPVVFRNAVTVPGWPGFGSAGTGQRSLMPTDGRRVLAIALGISSIFDVTGATVLRLVRRSLPEPPQPGSRPDPFRAAMDTIMEAHREVAPHARHENDGDWAAPQARDENDGDSAAPQARDENDGDSAAPQARDENDGEATPCAPNKAGVTLPA